MRVATSDGAKILLDFAREFTTQCFKPAYKFGTLMHLGCTDAWTKVVRLLCEPGDHIIVEQFTFPSSMGVWIPLGIKGAPIKMDADGMQSVDLRRVLENWDVDHPGQKRPHV